jgi:hypothetical protein
MAFSPENEEKTAAFGFYNAYLSVIYGLVVTEGLQCVVKFQSDGGGHQWDWLSVFLFVGTFLVSLHFWYVCATVDDLSRNFYRTLAEQNNSLFDLLLLLDSLVATSFAGFVLAMFYAVPAKGSRFFRWFLCAAGLSLLYDLASGLLVLYSRRAPHREPNGKTIEGYGKKVTQWISGDIVFVTVSGAAMYFSDHEFGVQHPFSFGCAFAAFNVFLLLIDVDLFALERCMGW